jgi:hypothetical protein
MKDHFDFGDAAIEAEDYLGPARTRESVRERDLDNFLIEELSASSTFRRWLLERLSSTFEVPQHAEIAVGKYLVQHSRFQ